jgi:glycosyltransferase involved in cell wall biosynthesis
MSKEPLVTVIIPFYNGEAYLQSAIDSVLNQTFYDFELLLINDGSTDASRSIAERYHDARIQLLDNDGNRGIIFTRNRGLSEARGSLVALLDCDDVALPDRLALQCEYLADHPCVMMVGGQAEVIDADGIPTGDYYKMPIGSSPVHVELLFRNAFVNSTVMFRKDAVQEIGGYQGRGYAEDYDLAFRLSERYQVDNLDKALIQYRVHGRNISLEKAELMREGEEELVSYFHRRLAIPRIDQLQKTHLSFIRPLSDFKPSLMDYFYLFAAIKDGNDRTGVFPKDTLDRELLRRWYELIRQSRSNKSLNLFLKRPIFDPAYASFKMYRKMLKQSLGIM